MPPSMPRAACRACGDSRPLLAARRPAWRPVGAVPSDCRQRPPTPAGTVAGPVPAPPTPSPTPQPAATTSPLSGRKGGVDTPVMVVKYDNTAYARSPTPGSPRRTSSTSSRSNGVSRGSRRCSRRASRRSSGPVRSARVSDIDMFAPVRQRRLRLLRRPAEALARASGARTGPRSPRTAAAPASTASPARYAPYRPDGPAAGDARRAVADVGGESADMGLVFDRRAPRGGSSAPPRSPPAGPVDSVAVPVERKAQGLRRLDERPPGPRHRGARACSGPAR